MIFSSRPFLQKTNERILLYYYETSGRLAFVHFLEEIEDTKKTFRNYLTFSSVLNHVTIYVIFQRPIEAKEGVCYCFVWFSGTRHQMLSSRMSIQCCNSSYNFSRVRDLWCLRAACCFFTQSTIWRNFVSGWI